MRQVLAVVGATATGKSELALVLAHALNGEVVNADASQLYRGMDVGTAKLSVAERQEIPHHLLDVIEVRDEASVAAFQRDSRAAIADIQQRGKTAILVGGSGLYVRAAIDTLHIPPTDPQVRAAWEQRLHDEGADSLFALLQAQDPAAAAQMSATNTRRLVRALEVIELTGQPFAATMPAREFVQPTIMIGLRADQRVLDERIDARAARMWEQGLLDEVRRLDTFGLREGVTASRAIGYAQALRQLDGDLAEADAIAETAAITRKFSRRQRSWFNPDQRISWFAYDDPRLGERAIELARGAATQ